MKREQPSACVVNAPCKINLHLCIGDKRPDGFHSLESLFVSLAFGDTLRLERSAQKKGDCHLFMEWEVPAEEIAPENNLVVKAVSLFRQHSGFESDLKILLNKRIPAGAGLGGASSDAASCLLALNFLAGKRLSDADLGKMAAQLGSDVPFFLGGGAAMVSGRGEIVESVKIPENLWVLLAKPPFSSKTAEAFRLLDEARAVNGGKKSSLRPIERPCRGGYPGGILSSAEQIKLALNGKPDAWPFWNDFLPLFCSSFPESSPENTEKAAIYREILESLREQGASFSGLSGSGSCCFGIFDTENLAKNAEKALSGRVNFLRLTFFLARRPDPVLQ